MQGFDWSHVPGFLAALDHGSLAEAARQTGISQPTLGRHIDELEHRLGVVLFERGRMGLAPTDTALEIAAWAREMQQAGDAMMLAASGRSESVSGPVRITASEIVATYLLPRIISDLLEQLPEIEIEVDASNSVGNLLQRDADIAIRMVRPIQNDLISRHVNTMEMGIYAHREYMARKGAVSSFEELADHVVIGYDRNDLILRGFAAAGFAVERDFFRYRCDDQVTAFEALVAGLGIGFAPRAIAARYPQLIPVLEEFTIEGLPMWLTSHRELRTSRKIRRVNDLLAKGLAALDLS